MNPNPPIHPAAQILVVDDEAVTRMMIRRVLEDSGCRVLEAGHGEEALALAEQHCPDLVLMDVRMPRMNGFDACRALRERGSCRHTPVLMLTALDDVMAVTLAFEAGATDFITKPINWALLGQRVRYALRSSATELELRDSQRALARAQKMARLGQWRLDLADRRLHFSPQLRELIGAHLPDPVRGSDILPLLSPADQPRLRRFIDELCQRPGEAELELQILDPAQGLRHLILAGDLVLDAAGQPAAIFGVAQDVTERREAEARLSYLAHFDEVTGLPNRVLLRDRLSTALAAAGSGGPAVALLQIEADLLQRSHGALSQPDSDRMLRAMAERLGEDLGPRDTLSRLEGDRFCLLLHGLTDAAAAAARARRLVQAFALPLRLGEATGERELLVSLHIGVALHPADGRDADALLLHAGVSCAQAREAGVPGFRFFTRDLHDRAIDRLDTEVALYRGLERGEFELHYQPKVDLRTGGLNGVEALLRWNRPGLGLQMPDRFIGILEQTGLITAAGDWVLREACRSLRDLPIGLAVNVSPRQFLQPKLVERLTQILDEARFPAERLELEITEQLVVEDLEGTVATLHRLAERGFRVALDDYGTGFSSLERLKRLPLHTLKIDRNFVIPLRSSPADAAIVRSTIDLCHQLGIQVVAEGVEDAAVQALLREYGCDLGQGYGICRPLARQALDDWIAAQVPVG
ncbi:MAG: EAL domain-containing protein [Leptothrix sp. (in: Bacteria)]|nr:EAL domain-containing protein [Leptothrix sp. (in: b-proteobacteria)]